MSHTPGPWKVVPDKDESTIDTYHIRTMYDKSIAHIDVFCSDTLRRIWCTCWGIR